MISEPLIIIIKEHNNRKTYILIFDFFAKLETFYNNLCCHKQKKRKININDSNFDFYIISIIPFMMIERKFLIYLFKNIHNVKDSKINSIFGLMKKSMIYDLFQLLVIWFINNLDLKLNIRSS